MSDIGSIADVATQGLKIVWNLLNPSKRKLLKEIENEALNDEDQFKKNLLARDSDSVVLQLNSCVSTTCADLTTSEYSQLQQQTLTVDANTLLRLFCCAREADRLRRQLQIIYAEK